MPVKELFECNNCETVYILTVIDTTFDAPRYCPCCGSQSVEKLKESDG